jgi:hypothetical protein
MNSSIILGMLCMPPQMLSFSYALQTEFVPLNKFSDKLHELVR